MLHGPYLRLFLFWFILQSLQLSSYSQQRIHYSIQGSATFSSDEVPFWMRSNTYGNVPMKSLSSSLGVNTFKNYSASTDSTSRKKKIFDWGFSSKIKVNSNLSDKEIIFTEGYFKGKLGQLELRFGRSEETMGLTGDTLLTSGSFAISGNALGIPKIEISTPNYVTIPILNNLFSFKGSFAHGWVGGIPIHYPYSRTDEINADFHQKSLYVKFSNPKWRLQLLGGFSHQVMWGEEKKIYRSFDLSPIKTYLYVVSGKRFGGNSVETSKVGNHIGSIDLAIKYDFNNWGLTIYRQNFYDVGALYYLQNIQDGLNGISFLNKRPAKGVSIRRALFEYLYSKNQAGEAWSKHTPSGDEDYYNNSMYKEGWSYRKLGLGNPLMSNSRIGIRNEVATYHQDYFINNRVSSLHFGMQAAVTNFLFSAKVSFSTNYGTYGTSVLGHSLMGKRSPTGILFEKTKQLSTLIQGEKQFNRNFSLHCLFSLDKGGLLKNSYGGLIKIEGKF